jgi:hypothetical protein
MKCAVFFAFVTVGLLSRGEFRPSSDANLTYAASQIQNSNSRLLLSDMKGQSRGFMGVVGDNQERTRFYLSDPSGRQRVQINVFPNNQSPEILLFDARGQRIASLGEAARWTGPAIPPFRLPDEKADQATQQDIRTIQTQLDNLNKQVQLLTDALNRR